MKNWIYRPIEIKYLLNPAFCGRLLFRTIHEYQKQTNRSFPFPLIYLVLPLILHEETRKTINSKKRLINWIHEHSEIMVSFPKRARDYVGITNEAVEWLMQTGYIVLNESGELEKAPEMRALSDSKFVNPEIKECLLKAGHVGRWFAAAGKTQNVYIGLGVRP